MNYEIKFGPKRQGNFRTPVKLIFTATEKVNTLNINVNYEIPFFRSWTSQPSTMNCMSCTYKDSGIIPFKVFLSEEFQESKMLAKCCESNIGFGNYKISFLSDVEIVFYVLIKNQGDLQSIGQWFMDMVCKPLREEYLKRYNEAKDNVGFDEIVFCETPGLKNSPSNQESKDKPLRLIRGE